MDNRQTMLYIAAIAAAWYGWKHWQKLKTATFWA